MWVWVAAGLVVLAGVVVFLRLRFVAVTVEGLSMEPTFAAGDRVLVRRVRVGAVRAGQVVVARPPEGLPGAGWLIKRAVAVPGDVVPREAVAALRDVPEERVPAGALVLLGDNAAVSFDSRKCGYFLEGQLLGVAVRRLPAARG
ncbi:S26 family signal peptidase [Longispora albida]|uniref:S26 family signal peptidase n=1 Tax=Longispora albida TaxID=203523 RepID=UPI00037ED3BC|nr:S26 family signal peptidase [Longispora albida]